MLRFAQAVEHQMTEIALNLDIELTTTCFLRRAVFWVFVFVAATSILSSMGVATEVMVNTLTSVSFAIGLASQQMLTDMVAGVMVMIWRPFKVGDLIEIEGTDVRGFVYDVLLSETRVDTEANERVSIPNSKIFGQMTRNLSRNPMMRLDIDLDIPLAKDIEMCKKVMLQVLDESRLGDLALGMDLDGRPGNDAGASQAPVQEEVTADEGVEEEQEGEGGGHASEKRKKRKNKAKGGPEAEGAPGAGQKPSLTKSGSFLQALDTDQDGKCLFPFSLPFPPTRPFGR